MFAGLQQSVTPVSFDLAFESVLVCYLGCIFNFSCMHPLLMIGRLTLLVRLSFNDVDFCSYVHQLPCYSFLKSLNPPPTYAPHNKIKINAKVCHWIFDPSLLMY
jgi:hypothetical protein